VYDYVIRIHSTTSHESTFILVPRSSYDSVYDASFYPRINLGQKNLKELLYLRGVYEAEFCFYYYCYSSLEFLDDGPSALARLAWFYVSS
jgi:hypothetical protein